MIENAPLALELALDMDTMILFNKEQCHRLHKEQVEVEKSQWKTSGGRGRLIVTSTWAIAWKSIFGIGQKSTP